MARFLADENFPYPVTEELRRLGHDVATMADLGKATSVFPTKASCLLASPKGELFSRTIEDTSYGFTRHRRATAESLSVRSTLTSLARQAGSVMPSQRLVIWLES